jgi:hypothetical protein
VPRRRLARRWHLLAAMARSHSHPGLGGEWFPDRTGTTLVGDCCAFTWTQKNILRAVLVHEHHHYDCVQKLLALAESDRVAIRLVYRNAIEPNRQ